MLSDAEIVKQFKGGNADSFGLLYDRYIEKIYSFVYYKTQHRETAEDLVSQIFLKAVKNLKKFDTSKGTVQAWLYQIARNTVIDHYRGQKQDKNIDDIWDLPMSSNIERDLDAKLKLEKIEKYLSTLKSEQRDVLIMKIWQGMSYEEIAEILGKSEASCKMMCSRSLRQLREAMPLEMFLLLLMLWKT